MTSDSETFTQQMIDIQNLFESVLLDQIESEKMSIADMKLVLSKIIHRISHPDGIDENESISKIRSIFRQITSTEPKQELNPQEKQITEDYTEQIKHAIEHGRREFDDLTRTLVAEYEERGKDFSDFIDDFVGTLHYFNLKLKVTSLGKNVVAEDDENKLNKYFSKNQLQILFHYLQFEPKDTRYLFSLLWFFIGKGYNVSFHPMQNDED